MKLMRILLVLFVEIWTNNERCLLGWTKKWSVQILLLMIYNTRNDLHNVQDVETKDSESQGFVASIGHLTKRKTTNRLAARVATTLQVNEATDPKPREENHFQEEVQQGNGASTQSVVIGHNTETQAKSQTRGRGNRGKYMSYVVDMKIRGKGSKLKLEIPNEIDRAIGENARHLVNECGRLVRTKAPF